jgi:hypothetical protein
MVWRGEDTGEIGARCLAADAEGFAVWEGRDAARAGQAEAARYRRVGYELGSLPQPSAEYQVSVQRVPLHGGGLHAVGPAVRRAEGRVEQL